MKSAPGAIVEPVIALDRERAMNYLRGIVLLLAVIAISGTAGAATRKDTVVDSITGKEIAALLAGFGYDVEVDEDDQGDPYFITSKNGTNFVVIFYGCDKNPSSIKRICGDIQFRSSYEAPAAASLDRMNNWNRDFRFGKAYVDADGDPTIEMVVNMSGGVTPSFLRNTLKWWTIVLRDFEDHIGWETSSYHYEPKPRAGSTL